MKLHFCFALGTRTGGSPPRSRSSSRLSGTEATKGSRDLSSRSRESRAPARARCVSLSHLFKLPSVGCSSIPSFLHLPLLSPPFPSPPRPPVSSPFSLSCLSLSVCVLCARAREISSGWVSDVDCNVGPQRHRPEIRYLACRLDRDEP